MAEAANSDGDALIRAAEDLHGSEPAVPSSEAAMPAVAGISKGSTEGPAQRGRGPPPGYQIELIADEASGRFSIPVARG